MDRELGVGVLVADDDPAFRGIVARLLAAEPDIDVVAEVGSGQEAVALVVELLPQVALLDVRMPHMDGIEATRAIHAAVPTTNIVMLTTSDEEDDVYGALRAGASGYLLKDAGMEGLPDAVRMVAAGLGSVLSPSIAARLLGEFPDPARRDLGPTLSERELEVLRLIGQGLTNQEIARRLILSDHTVKRHVANILGKLHQHSRLDAVRMATEEGVLGT